MNKVMDEKIIIANFPWKMIENEMEDVIGSVIGNFAS